MHFIFNHVIAIFIQYPELCAIKSEYAFGSFLSGRSFEDVPISGKMADDYFQNSFHFM